jgi:hypothetical protein
MAKRLKLRKVTLREVDPDALKYVAGGDTEVSCAGNCTWTCPSTAWTQCGTCNGTCQSCGVSACLTSCPSCISYCGPGCTC